MYQFVLRANLRVTEDDNTKPVTVYVPDLRAGNFLMEMFPNATLKYIDFGVQVKEYEPTGNDPGRPSKYPEYFTRRLRDRYVYFCNSGKNVNNLTPEEWYRINHSTRVDVNQ
jgi:hypothetical protein